MTLRPLLGVIAAVLAAAATLPAAAVAAEPASPLAAAAVHRRGGHLRFRHLVGWLHGAPVPCRPFGEGHGRRRHRRRPLRLRRRRLSAEPVPGAEHLLGDRRPGPSAGRRTLQREHRRRCGRRRRRAPSTIRPACAATGSCCSPARRTTLVPTSVVDDGRHRLPRLRRPRCRSAWSATWTAPHAMITRGLRQSPATPSRRPFINDCGFDLAGAVLAQIYGPLAPPTPAAGEFRALRADRVRRSAASRHGLAARGYVYVPAGVRRQAAAACTWPSTAASRPRTMIGDAFVRHAGYNEWAEANHIVVLYPQARRAAAPRPRHPAALAEPAGLLGLVGLHRPRLRAPDRPADPGDQRDDRPLGGTRRTFRLPRPVAPQGALSGCETHPRRRMPVGHRGIRQEGGIRSVHSTSRVRSVRGRSGERPAVETSDRISVSKTL